MLGNDYRCHLNYAHDIFEDEDDNEAGNLEDDNESFQCEICSRVLKGKKVVEEHIKYSHSTIVKELEEDVADFYALIRIVSKVL